MLKTILGNPVFQYVVGRTIGFYMLFVGVTTRWTRVNQAAVEPYWRGEGKLIACIWHGRFTLVHKMWKFGAATKPKFLISRSREGGLVAWVSRTVGADVIRGSAAKRGQQKGGVEATLQMARHLDEAGGIMGMTPDGPRGPRMRAKRGAVQLARLAGAPLMGVTWATSNRIVFQGSWDKFVFPLPFGRGALVWTDPIPVPADADDATMERIRQKLETEMNRIAAEADAIAGVPVIEPAPPRHVAEHITDETEAAESSI
ncbi:MAG: lysophospholipid acyltransferase family protein [Terricaulis sp.]